VRERGQQASPGSGCAQAAEAGLLRSEREAERAEGARSGRSGISQLRCRVVAVTRAIEIRTEIPGPRSREILAREREAVAHPLIVHLPIFAADAEGATITDVDGNRFIDFAGGVGVMNVGHGHPRVVEAVQEQAGRFLHTDFTVVPYESYVELAERLGELAPISGPTRAAFFNAGTEAVENAVKFARLATGRQAVIAFEGAFHGRTLLSLTMTSKPHPYKTGLGPFSPEVYRAPYPNEYRGVGASEALEQLEYMLHTHVPAEHVAAIVFEPEQGEGGFIPAPAAFVEGLRELCDRDGIVLVADEVQTGFGRTGRMFAMEHFGVEPDLVTVAKSIAAGLPLSGVIGRAEIMDAAHSGAVGGTYIGNPVALAAACAVLDVFAEENLVARAQTIGETIRGRMLAWQERHAQIGDVRGLGAMLAVELVHDPESKEPAPELAESVIDAALARGLILLKAGVHGNCIRVLCPLTITDLELDEALEVWGEAIATALS
jgi:4-aminobutyrate aminotransferase/(S)-3-amino-2-methylpropionate transaminase